MALVTIDVGVRYCGYGR